MESKELKSVLEKDAGARVLEHGAIGRSGPIFVRVSPEKTRETLVYLRDRFEPRMEWLEHITAADQAGTLVLSYFLRPLAGRADVVVKCALEPGPDESWVECPGVGDLFGTARALEPEISELFGIGFAGQEDSQRDRRRLLAPGTKGFPMRKGSGVRA